MIIVDRDCGAPYRVSFGPDSYEDDRSWIVEVRTDDRSIHSARYGDQAEGWAAFCAIKNHFPEWLLEQRL